MLQRPVAPIGRAAVSKAARWGFESLLACHSASPFNEAKIGYGFAEIMTS